MDLTGVYPCFLDPVAFGQEMKASVLKMTGIPVCVGLAPTKTLAKLANFAAKKWPKTQGVVDLSDRTRRNRLLAVVPVGEVWGVGHRIAQRLNALGILSASDLAQQPVDYIKQQFNVVLARTVMELNGVACLSLEEVVPAKQQIVCSRSFGSRLLTKEALASVLAEFSVRVGEKLRKQHSLAQHISIFIRTNPFSVQDKQYQRAASLSLPIATQDTRVIIKATSHLLNEIYQPGFAYHKAGVQLGQINPVAAFHQLHLFDPPDLFQDKQHDLMETVDCINRKFPKKLRFAATCVDRSWLPKRELSSPRYTTCWQELAVVSCR